jgi:glycosyltransferase involved in cell wall biosynthesis
MALADKVETGIMRIAFHSPLNDPDSGTPSGDRLMARQIIACLGALGHDVRLVSRFRSWLDEPAALPAMEIAAATERARIWPQLQDWQPGLWFTYHLYYRAPDLLGPQLSQRLNVPYVAAEASWSSRRREGPWAAAQALAEAGLGQARALFAMTGRDAEGLARCPGIRAPILRLPPFLVEPGPEPAARPAMGQPGGGQVQLLTVAMMRKGDKLDSYQVLAGALARLSPGSWHLSIIGNGPARPLVEIAFSAFSPSQVTWCGALGTADVRQAMDNADLFVWPGLNEAYGMVFLEAQARGLSVVAMASAGVPSVVSHGLGGLLAAEGDVDGYAEMMMGLVDNEPLRLQLGQQARAHVTASHALPAAMRILSEGLEPVLSRPRTRLDRMDEDHAVATR